MANKAETAATTASTGEIRRFKDPHARRSAIIEVWTSLPEETKQQRRKKLTARQRTELDSVLARQTHTGRVTQTGTTRQSIGFIEQKVYELLIAPPPLKQTATRRKIATLRGIFSTALEKLLAAKSKIIGYQAWL